MKSHSKYIVPIFLLTICLACTGDYSLEFPEAEPKLVVDAWLSSEYNDSYIKLGWTFNMKSDCATSFDPLEKLENACTAERLDENYQVKGIMTLTEEYGKRYEFSIKMQSKKGLFVFNIDTIKGTPGKWHFLDIDILYNGKVEHYHSEAYMHVTPEIQSISYEVRENYLSEKKEQYIVPLISFEEDVSVKNYYLFRVCRVRPQPNNNFTTICGDSFNNLPYSVTDDSLLPKNVSQFPVDDGVNISKLTDDYPDYGDNDNTGAEVHMWSVSKETHEFYKAIVEQFSSDGGAYRPSPATPPGNISNGAVGLFRAVDPSIARVFPD